jgi:hypothetical protein
MKKKVLYGAIAAALVALNAFAFSSYARIGERPGGIKENPYQTLYYCSSDNLNYSCTWMKTSLTCFRACDGSEMIPVPKPITPPLVDM